MKVLLINKFLRPVGGDATCTLSTGELLRRKGHDVIFWGMAHPDNPAFPAAPYFVDDIDYHGPTGLKKQVMMAAKLLYSTEAKMKIEKLVRKDRPDIVHLNNFAHQISPSVLDVFRKEGIPAVMTLMDYKVVCPTYLMMREDRPCELCRGGRYYNCFLRKCTKESYSKSLLNAVEMYLHHDILHIYDTIRTYIASSNFLKDKVIEMGLKGRVVKLFNFVEAGDYEPSYGWQEKSVIYFGRISREKGVRTLIDAGAGLDMTLKIVGDGPEKRALEEYVRSSGIKNVAFIGYRKGKALEDEIKKSMFTVIPSEWYENNPRAVIEALAFGKPVIGSRIGGIPELIVEGRTGFLYNPGDPADLRQKLQAMLNDKNAIVEMGRNARKFLEEELDAEQHYERLIEIYKQAIGNAAR